VAHHCLPGPWIVLWVAAGPCVACLYLSEQIRSLGDVDTPQTPVSFARIASDLVGDAHSMRGGMGSDELFTDGARFGWKKQQSRITKLGLFSYPTEGGAFRESVD